MSDASDGDEIDRIREQKRQELIEGADTGSEAGEDGGDAPTEPVHVESADHLDRLVEQYDTVLVDFYADWCGPCEMLEPTVEEIAEEGRAVVAKVDIDRLQGLAQQAGVRGVPTLQLFADGREVKQWVGVQDKGTLTAAIDRVA
jgi:thioredoxin 1